MHGGHLPISIQKTISGRSDDDGLMPVRSSFITAAMKAMNMDLEPHRRRIRINNRRCNTMPEG
jgi:hypothetical protein